MQIFSYYNFIVRKSLTNLDIWVNPRQGFLVLVVSHTLSHHSYRKPCRISFSIIIHRSIIKIKTKLCNLLIFEIFPFLSRGSIICTNINSVTQTFQGFLVVTILLKHIRWKDKIRSQKQIDQRPGFDHSRNEKEITNDEKLGLV